MHNKRAGRTRALHVLMSFTRERPISWCTDRGRRVRHERSDKKVKAKDGAAGRKVSRRARHAEKENRAEIAARPDGTERAGNQTCPLFLGNDNDTRGARSLPLDAVRDLRFAPASPRPRPRRRGDETFVVQLFGKKKKKKK